MPSLSAERRDMAKLTAFTMPKWGIEMSEGTIAEWLVAENAPFAKGALLALIETDKITNEVEAEANGRFVRLIAALIAVLSDGGEASAAEIDALIAAFTPSAAGFGDDDDDISAAAPVIVSQPAVAADLPERPRLAARRQRRGGRLHPRPAHG